MSGIILNGFSTTPPNVRPSIAQPLPRLTPRPMVNQDEGERYEIVISGAGPAGLYLHLLLARYGLKDSVLCVDAKPASIRTGHADGLNARTLEVFKTLNIVDEILNHGCALHEHTSWGKPPGATTPGIQREYIMPLMLAPARFAQCITIHQGHIQRILEEDLQRYSGPIVERGSRLVSVQIDEEQDPNFPVKAEIEHDGHTRTVRAKHLVGADGAHSVVRRLMSVQMDGDTTDHVWGAIDLVADTDFPDIRRMGNIHSDDGGILLIPREKNSRGEHLTRLYVSTAAISQTLPATLNGLDDQNVHQPEVGREAKSHITAESILQQASKIMHPYRVLPKQGTEIEWWSAYQVGQRVAQRFIERDSKGIPRLFIVGDACHTHSPKAGQGMNVSMMDSYDLAWKLMYSLNGLTPDSRNLLNSYEVDRRGNALNLIDFDKRWYEHTYSNSNGPPSTYMLKEMGEFFSGCGNEYKESWLVDRNHQGRPSPVTSSDYWAGVLREGRRLFDVAVFRFADGCPYHIQDDFPSDGRFRILVLASTDLLDINGRSATTLNYLCTKLVPQFLPGFVELVILQPLDRNSFQWTDITPCVKEAAEMRFHHGPETAYAAYGIDPSMGGLVVVRPDGFVGTIANLDDTARVDQYLRRVLKV